MFCSKIASDHCAVLSVILTFFFVELEICGLHHFKNMSMFLALFVNRKLAFPVSVIECNKIKSSDSVL